MFVLGHVGSGAPPPAGRLAGPVVLLLSVHIAQVAWASGPHCHLLGGLSMHTKVATPASAAVTPGLAQVETSPEGNGHSVLFVLLCHSAHLGASLTPWRPGVGSCLLQPEKFGFSWYWK